MYLINCSRTTEAQEEALFCSHECEEAARQLGLPDTGASEERVSNYPPFCYLHRGKSLWFNNLGTSATTCDSDDICICHNGVGCELYHQKLTSHNCKKKCRKLQITVGSQATHLVTKSDQEDECEYAASRLGHSDTTAHMINSGSYPPYCSSYRGSLKWNTLQIVYKVTAYKVNPDVR